MGGGSGSIDISITATGDASNETDVEQLGRESLVTFQVFLGLGMIHPIIYEILQLQYKGILLYLTESENYFDCVYIWLMIS